MQAFPIRIVLARILLVGGLVLAWGGARADETPLSPVTTAPDPADAEAIAKEKETYLAPLKALESDETAFLDKLWAMGDAEFARIGELSGLLQSMKLSPEEAVAATNEMARRTAYLKTLGEYGVDRFEHNARARNFHGVVYYDALGMQMEALKEWHMAVSLDKDYSDPYNNLGMHYFHSGDYPLGFQNMDMALKLEPKNPDYCYNMAQNYLIFRPQSEEYRGWSAKKVYKEAMKLSKRATKEAPEDYEILEDYAVNFLAAENFGVEADWKEAIKAWVVAREQAHNVDQKYFTWLNEGRAWRKLDNKDEAIRCFKEALALRPGSELPQRLIEELTGGASS